MSYRPRSSRRLSAQGQSGHLPAQVQSSEAEARAVAQQAPGEIRLIGGRWKRSKLTVPVSAGLRPTPDRVRETLFNWLGQDLSGWRVLDAFAGSGALGLEAASRGAVQVLLIEQAPRLVSHLQQSCQRLGATTVQVQREDAMAWMRRRVVVGWDLVLLDPPFGTGSEGFEAAVQAAVPLLQPEGWLYLEADRAYDAQACAAWGLRLHRHGRAGMVHFHLLQRSVETAQPLHSAP